LGVLLEVGLNSGKSELQLENYVPFNHPCPSTVSPSLKIELIMADSQPAQY